MDPFSPFLNPFESPDAELLALKRHVEEAVDRMEQLVNDRLAALDWRLSELEQTVADLRGGSGR